MECKGTSRSHHRTGTAVLIETLWNVKYSSCSNISSKLPRINRNIVECKEVEKTEDVLASISINRNIVECKEKLNTSRVGKT